jgi:hypothetical protein
MMMGNRVERSRAKRLAGVALALCLLGCGGKERDFGSALPEQGGGEGGPTTADMGLLPNGAAGQQGGNGFPRDGSGTGESVGAVGLQPPAAAGGNSGVPSSIAGDAGVVDLDGPVLTSELEQADLGDAEEGTTGSSFTWVVTNSGRASSGPLTLTQAGADFLVTNGCTGTLGAGSSCSITLTFAPQVGGPRSSTLTLSDGVTDATLLALGNARVRLTIDRLGVGAVTSAQGINCGDTCTALFDVGAQVTLQATTTNGSDAFFSGWSVATCGPARTCTIEVTGRQTLTATFAPMLNNLMFFSSEELPANLGGVLPYDAACNRMATAVGINNAQGTGFLALLSDTTNGVRERFAAGVQGWVRLDGKAFTSSVGSLFDQNVIYYPASFDENGVAAPANPQLRVMTGMETDGAARETCNDWSTLDPTVQGTSGTRLGGPIVWTFRGGVNCDVPSHVICMGNTKSAALQLEVSTGKRIWSTAPTFTIGAGVTPDAACFADRPAGIAGARALLSYTTSPAGAVIQPEANYVRLDGQLVGTGQQLLDGDVLTGIWQAADGTYQAPESRIIIVPTGAESPAELGTPESTCNDWTDPAGTMASGAFANADAGWWLSNSNRTCADPVALYCVEE